MTQSELAAKIRANLSRNALTNLEAVGGLSDDDAMIASDVAALQSGTSVHALLATCLNGVEDQNVIAGWNEYVRVVERQVHLSR